MNTNKNQIYIYTDGACKGNPGPGGWGAFIKYNDKTLELHGGELDTTNNKMELTAVIEALKAIKDKGKPIIIITDSTYVKNGIEQWIHNWKKNGWKSAAKKPVKNMELWQQLDNEVAKINNLKWEWVKGHSGDIGNEKADELANLGVQKVIHQ
jgi:ribonuclease HI